MRTHLEISGVRIRNFPPGSGSAQEKDSELAPALIRNEIFFLYIRTVQEQEQERSPDYFSPPPKFNFINHHFRLEFVDSVLYFVLDENNFIYT